MEMDDKGDTKTESYSPRNPNQKIHEVTRGKDRITGDSKRIFLCVLKNGIIGTKRQSFFTKIFNTIFLTNMN